MAKEIEKVATEVAEVEEVKTVETVENDGKPQMKSTKQIISALKKAGAIPVNGLTIKNVTVTTFDSYVRVALTLTDYVKCFRTDDGVEYTEGYTNVIFASTFNISAILKNDPKLAFLGDMVIEKPAMLKILLSYATIDILQELAPANIEYVNPFSSGDSESNVKAYDRLINHITAIRFNDLAMEDVKEIRRATLLA